VDAGLSHDPGIPSGGADRLAGVSQIVLDDVHKVYPDGTEAVRGVELTVPDGALAVLVGPSGCGKTTLLRMVAGLEAITDGQVRIGDRVVNDVSPKDRDLAMVFQDYALYPQMSVFENMAFGLRLRKMARSSIRARVEDAARSLGLAELLTKRPRQLSGGQRQRVAMGRAIVREPKGFLMDEPLSNLDAKLRVQMRAEVRRIQRELGVTTMYVTHDQTEAMTMGDWVAVMKRGVLQQWDRPQELYSRPANLFVAGFIGSPAMNLVEAQLAGDDGGLWIELPGELPGVRVAVEPPARAALAGYRGQAVVVGIRPEAFRAAGASDGAVEGAPRLRVAPDLCEAMGPDVYVHFAIEARPVVTEDIRELAADAGVAAEELEREAAEPRSVWVARVSPDARPREGEPLELVLDARKLHFFDPGTGAALYP
jgi:multiple sugar transport system ATP-binding protein